MWYVIQTDSGKEENTCRKCGQVFPDGSYDDIFVPGYMRLVKRGGVWSEERKVLFPGYFFVDAKEPDIIEDILRNYLYRIAKPVCVGNDFIPIYEDEQSFLEGLMDADHVIKLSRGDIIDGKTVLSDGPMRDRTERIAYIDRHKRIADVRVYLHGVERKMRVGMVIVNKNVEEYAIGQAV